MSIKCKLFGHKPEDFTDSGYLVCSRCKAHEYYDHDKWFNYGFVPRLPRIIPTKFWLWKAEFDFKYRNKLPF